MKTLLSIYLRNCTFGNTETKKNQIAGPPNIHNKNVVTISYASMISLFPYYTRVLYNHLRDRFLCSTGFILPDYSILAYLSSYYIYLRSLHRLRSFQHFRYEVYSYFISRSHKDMHVPSLVFNIYLLRNFFKAATLRVSYAIIALRGSKFKNSFSVE